MTRDLRRRHLLIWSVLAAVLACGIGAGLWSRVPAPAAGVSP